MTATHDPARRPWRFLAPVAAIDLIGLALAFWPVLLLTIGIQAIGATNGWWPGNPNSSGEEGFATLIGAIGMLLMVVATAIPVALLARRQRQPELRSTARNALYFLGACLMLGVLTVLL